jgi:hypothetical protein
MAKIWKVRKDCGRGIRRKERRTYLPRAVPDKPGKRRRRRRAGGC